MARISTHRSPPRLRLVEETPPVATRRELRVLHVANGNDYSGIARVMDLLALRLPDWGVRVGFACLRLGEFAEARESSEVPLHDISMKGRGDMSVVPRLARVAREGEYDLIHTHGPRAGLVGSAAALAARLPLVHHLHGCTLEVWPGRARNLVNVTIERAVLARAAAVVAVSEDLHDYLRRQRVPPVRLFVVPNGVPSTHEPVRLRAPAGTWTIGTVARFRSVKGMTVLFHALAQLRRRDVDLCFRGIGDFEPPAHRDELDALASRLGVADLIEWRGFRRDVAAELAALDIFVLPSFSEGMPMSVIEAMAVGVPIVATRVGGVPELLHDGLEGLLVAPGDPAALAHAIGRLVDGSVDAQALRSSAYLRQHELYTDDAMAARLAAVYRSVLAGVRIARSVDRAPDARASAVAG
jgi:phosphatidyl-myo-inositol alpha-mannosyltransferase